jgi:uncharacterized repeat protein (TIGR01451 family)
VTDTLPAGFNLTGFSGAGWSCGPQAGQTVTCTNEDDLAIGASASTLVLNVVADNSGLFVNTASVDVSGDDNSSNDTAEDQTEVIQAGIDLELTKSIDEDDGLFRGKRATYVLSVANVGTQTAVDRIRIVDALPDGVSFVSAAGGLDWTCNFVDPEVRCFSDEDLGPGESLQDLRIRVDVATDAPDELLNTASTSVNGESNPANDATTHAGTVEGYATDYALTKSHVGTFVAGEPGFYRLEVANVGFATGGNDVTILDQLPVGLSYDSASGAGWSCAAAGQDVTCTHAGNVEASNSLPTLTLRVNVGTDAIGSVTNMAVLSSPDDGNVANDVAADPTDVRAPLPDLTIDKSHTGNFTGAQQGQYTIEVTNLGEAAPGPTTITDDLPDGLNFVSASGTDWSCGEAATVVTCEYAGLIDGGESAPAVTITVAVAGSAANTTVINTASVANANDVNLLNNSDSDPTAVGDPQAPTELEAYPWLLYVNTLGGNHGLKGPSAVLTSNGAPVEGKMIEFRASKGTLICQAITNASGEARCKFTYTFLLSVLTGSLHYTASFAGTGEFKPASDTGQILRVYGIGL